MKLGGFLLASLFAAAVGLPAAAHEIVYTAILSGPAESPPNASPGTGSVTVTLDLDLITLRVQADFSGLTGGTTASHIHCCTAVAGVSTAIVATQTPSFLDFPLGVTSGTYDHTFDLAVAGSYNAAFITASGGTVSDALNALIAGLDAGKAYFNIHTSTFGGGEIRGFLTAVPEPSALALLGVAGLVRGRRRAA